MASALIATLRLIAVQAGAAPAHFSEQRVTGHSKGNHGLDWIVIRPWTSRSGPEAVLYAVIAWANGWDHGNVVGATTILGYKPGLIE